MVENNGNSLKTVLITGAASGIGEACANEFLNAGHSVIGWDLVAGENSKVDWQIIDITSPHEMFTEGSKLPDLYAVITCAGVGVRGPMMDTSPEMWHRVLAVNIEGTAFTAMAAFEALRRGRGTLVTFGSLTATSTFRFRAPYTASKAAVLALTKSLANEWAEDGIRVICVSPGFTRTKMLEDGLRSGQTDIGAILAHTPQKVLIEPEEIAASIRALVGPDFKRMTGANILIDAGWDSLTGF